MYFTVTAADLGTTWVRGGQTVGTEQMWVRGFDGADWSAWDAFTLNTTRLRKSHAPRVERVSGSQTAAGPKK